MGYNQKLPLLEPVTEDQVQAVIDVVAALPCFKHCHHAGKQSWGWSTICDVKLAPEPALYIDFHWAIGNGVAGGHGFPEMFFYEAEKQGLPVGVLGVATW
jgi:hypothetical protein